jgi:hypothetical protein
VIRRIITHEPSFFVLEEREAGVVGRMACGSLKKRFGGDRTSFFCRNENPQ